MGSLKKATDLYKTAMETIAGGGEGDDYYRCPVLRIELLQRALQLYNSELRTADPFNARPALLKNVAMASLRIAQAMVEANPGKEPIKVIYYVKECVRNLTLNWVWRPEERELEWGAKLSGSSNAAFNVAFASLGKSTDPNWAKGLHLLDSVLKEIGGEPCLDQFRLQFYIERADFYIRSVAKIMEMSDFKMANQVLEYCRCDYDMAKMYASSNPAFSCVLVLLQLQEIEEMTTFLKASCESVKLRNAADELLDSATPGKKKAAENEEDEDDEEDKDGSETLNFDLMWDILDMYKAAAISAKGQDIKNETIAIAKQGVMFHNVFKLDKYAKKYCKKAVEMGDILTGPRDFRKWYWDCVEVIKEYQRRQLEEEERKRQAERTPYLEELVEELKDLKAVEDCYLKLLKHVYAKHPPKIEPKFKYDAEKTDSTTVRKVLMKAIFHYHPDKQVEFGKKWQVLCEEITKCLTRKYEGMKGI